MKLLKHQLQYVTFGILAVLLSISCSKRLSPTQKDFKQYEINKNTSDDDAIVAIYTPYKQQMQAEMNRVIGFSEFALTKEKAPETLMGNFFTQALMDASERVNNKADIAFATKGGIRNEIKAGEITVENVFEVMPFENQLTIIELNGEQIQKLAEFIAATAGQPVTGLSLSIQNKQPIAIQIQGKNLDKNKVYKVVTYDYLANGGDNLDLFTHALKRNDYPQKVRESLMDYISNFTKNGQKIKMQLDGRVKIIK
ncbi:5'-nucleotidase C-terminal domain-containing protein [Sphingobacterium sp. SRCM116780]|uniref:5'-nucleotidase C-terminal domain-containing protein n=1 Tax=Sphingobacterium sp. SRCM116780 TaxID=2907623 RepID=UPI001F46CD6F|nr:5'-nucleotidase [Sphingobacterium sp. SRCM116780]UIR54509.1 5'-nucleotidase C-terminal domain-containing protein [Sphingobacterium sp. SRCM116780]